MSSTQNPTRQKILQATRAQLESGEPAKTRMADIAKAAGISRQALYLHFPNRAELMIATARFIDETYEIQNQLTDSRDAPNGEARLKAYISAWSDFLPHAYGVARAFLAMKDTDEAAAAAWEDRMVAMREGCEAAVTALAADGRLKSDYDSETATDILWSILSFRMWENLCAECGWSHEKYQSHIQRLARDLLIS